ncbi:hypothetical protein ACFQPC_09230 [Herminiimonas glaciei]|uniref:Uncharacterized protein n=1 Tax=Herminiimonas glaciei TaxID=523788 RepID=A0ABW2IB59_9BURK
MNKMPMRRICETAEIQPATLYGKIRQIHAKSVAFSANYEKMFDKNLRVSRLYLAVDRQEYIFNWGTELDRRNTILLAIGSADNSTGYVFGMHLDYDPELDAETVERDAILRGDYDQFHHNRHYARVWLQREHLEEFRVYDREKSRKGTLAQRIADGYNDSESGNQAPIASANYRLPPQGIQIHAEYTMAAHFYYLNALTKNVDKIRFFLDQDTGMRTSCLGAFSDRIKDRSVDAFLVRIGKAYTTSKKMLLKAKSGTAFTKARNECPSLNKTEIERLLMRNSIEQMQFIGESRDRWLMHPFPDMSEPEKAVCYLTDFEDYDLDHLASLYRKASLHSIDRFFMQLRRRISILERPFVSSSSNRTWYGYAAYNPAVAIQLMETFRVVYNFVLIGKDGLTPAMRLGIVDRPMTLGDLLGEA